MEYLIAEQDVLREQDGILPWKDKWAEWIKRAGWTFAIKRLSKQDLRKLYVNKQGQKFDRQTLDVIQIILGLQNSPNVEEFPSCMFIRKTREVD